MSAPMVSVWDKYLRAECLGHMVTLQETDTLFSNMAALRPSSDV